MGGSFRVGAIYAAFEQSAKAAALGRQLLAQAARKALHQSHQAKLEPCLLRKAQWQRAKRAQAAQ